MITYLQIPLFLWFPIYIRYRYGTLSSISASTYYLQGNQRGLFTAWLVGMALSMIPYAYFMPVWASLMIIGFTITGMSPEHRTNPNSLEDAFHTGGTILIIAAGFTGLYFHGQWFPQILVFGGGSGLLALYNNNAIWYIELLAFATITWGLLAT